MRKICFIILLCALALIACAAQADSYSFGDVCMTFALPAGVYERQLTPDNLEANAAFIASKGYTLEALGEMFTAQGVRLMAYDDDNDRALVVTVVQDELAARYFNIDDQTPAVRANYRVNHADGTYCANLGYTFSSCEWKNFGGTQGRFLMLKYTHKTGGAVDYRGLWRRTIRNGCTITLDLRVYGRQVTAGDITALNKIQDSIHFSENLNTPDRPMQLIVTSAPPQETNTNSFTVKGSTLAGAQLTAVLTSLSSTQNIICTAQANNTGNFSMKIELPREDFYFMSLFAQGSGAQEEQQDFSINYDAQLLPVTFTNNFPEAFTADTYKFSGATLSGVTVQVVVNGENVTKKTGNAKTFSFTVDTSADTNYKIEVTFSKKNFDSRVFRYEIPRTMTQAEKEQKIRDASVSPAYDRLNADIEGYTGRVIRYEGYVIDVREVAGEYSITFATKLSGERYDNIVMLTAAAPPDFDSGVKLTAYGELKGVYRAYVEGGEDAAYPLLTLRLLDVAQGA